MNPAGYTDYLIQGNGVTIPVNTGTPDEDGNYWYLCGDVGGWDSPDGRVTMLTKIGDGPGADGEYPADQHYRGRTITAKLACESSSEAQRQVARYRIAQALDLIDTTGLFIVQEEVPKELLAVGRSGNSSQGKLTISEKAFGQKLATEAFSRTVTDGQTTATSTTLSSATANFGPGDIGFPVVGPGIPPGTVVFSVTDSSHIVMSAAATATASGLTVTIGGVFGLPVGAVAWLMEVDIEIYATDPRKYAVTETVNVITGGTCSVTNAGNTDSQRIAITLTGLSGAGPLTIDVGGQIMRLVVPSVPSGAPALSDFPSELIIGVYERVIIDSLGNNYYYLRDLTTPWPVLQPGANAITVSGAGASAGEVDSYSAWI